MMALSGSTGSPLASGALPAHASVVVIGGGVIGCSVLYHLAKRGATDALLLERHEISSGTTWHSAAIVLSSRPSESMTAISRYSTDLYARLEQETGLSTGWRRNGFLNLGTSRDRTTSLLHAVSQARAAGVECEMVGPDDVARLWPLLDRSDVEAAMWVPECGRVDPTSLCHSLLGGARAMGARVAEHSNVDSIIVEGGRVRGVRCGEREVRCDTLIVCSGLWSREVAGLASAAAPLQACQHFYMLTDRIEGITPDLPALRDADSHLYMREDVGGLLIGCFEPDPIPVPLEQLPQGVPYILLDDNWDHFSPWIMKAMERVPAVAKVGVRSMINGPESFTPDRNPLLGPLAGLTNCYIAAGMNSSGVSVAGGLGRAVADWAVDGKQPLDLSMADVRRFDPSSNNLAWLMERAPESLSHHHLIPYPGHEYHTGRGRRRTPFHAQLERRGAKFVERAGWERAGCFFGDEDRSDEKLTFGRPPWFDSWAAEHVATRERASLMDMSPFAKFRIDGESAHAFLSMTFSRSLDIAVGRVVFTLLLNDAGGIEAEATITRLAADSFLVVSGSGQRTLVADLLARAAAGWDKVSMADVSQDFAVLTLNGPLSREILSKLTSADLSSQAFPFASARTIELGTVEALAIRLSYVGELGWELFIPSDQAPAALELLLECGEPMGLRLAGAYALASLRIEKGMRAWGQDIGPADNPYDAGLGIAVQLRRPDFVGRDALVAVRAGTSRSRLANILFEDALAYPLGGEPVLLGDQICGRLSSASYGHYLGSAVGLAWLKPSAFDSIGSRNPELTVEIAGERFAVIADANALYDPQNQRMKF